MKNFLKLCFLFLVVIFLNISCTKEEKPFCEEHNIGYVTVHNNSSFYLWVDATSVGEDTDHEIGLSPGDSYRYTVQPGDVKIWAIKDPNNGLNWNVKTITVNQCDEYEYTWTDKK